jgi:hypothetical protein
MAQLKLSDIVTHARHADPSNEDKQRLVALFIDRHNHLKEYLNLVLTGNNKGYKTYIEAVFERPLSELDPLFQKYLMEIVNDGDLIQKQPPSQIFEDRAAIKMRLPKRHLRNHGYQGGDQDVQSNESLNEMLKPRPLNLFEVEPTPVNRSLQDFLDGKSDCYVDTESILDMHRERYRKDPRR